MARAGLALWYTLTVLLGPALCCCSIRPASAATSSADHVADAPAPLKNKCCCPADASESCPDPADHRPPRDHHPDGCPCKKFEKQDQDRPGPSISGAETGFQCRSLDLPVAAPFAASHHLADRIDGNGAEFSGGAAGLAGRDLLTAYHILRC